MLFTTVVRVLCVATYRVRPYARVILCSWLRVAEGSNSSAIMVIANPWTRGIHVKGRVHNDVSTNLAIWINSGEHKMTVSAH